MNGELGTLDALGDLLREAFALVLASLLPMFAVAAVAAIVVGLLASALGLRDAALTQLVRSLAVVLALGVLVSEIAAATVEFATHSWAGLDGSQPDAQPDSQPDAKP